MIRFLNYYKVISLIGIFIIAFVLKVQFGHDNTALEKGPRIRLESTVI